MPKRNDLEHRALEVVMRMGKDGILQSDLWRELKASSREGSRISLKLEKKGLVKRQQELYEGRWTYRLYTKRMPSTITSILDCPCMICSDIDKCSAGDALSPETCPKLTNWLNGVPNIGAEISVDNLAADNLKEPTGDI